MVLKFPNWLENNIWIYHFRFSTIESQPKKVVVVAVDAVFIVVIIVDHKNLTLKFDQNWVNNKRYKLGLSWAKLSSSWDLTLL